MKKINDNKSITGCDDAAVRRILQSKAYAEGENQWFTPRLMNRLPRKESVPPGRMIMTVVTVLSVIICFATLYVFKPIPISPDGSNHFDYDLLYIHIALASAVILVTLQVIRLIKTYF